MTPTESYPDLAKAIGIPGGLYFKREDLHPYGSHKGRSIPVMIEHYYAGGDRRFAITGSGNAALAAVLYVQEINEKKAKEGGDQIDLDVFVGNHISPKKLAKIKKAAEGAGSAEKASRIRILIKERPLQALAEAMQEGARSLRQSTDDAALAGYGTLARELADMAKIGAVFIGTSSGTTAQALASYFLKEKALIQVHIVQTSSCHPMSDAFETYEGPGDETSIADAIVDRTAQRKPALIPLVEKTGGRGWFATNENIEAAQELVAKHTGLEISTNSALSVVGAIQAAYLGYEIQGAAVCLICGD